MPPTILTEVRTIDLRSMRTRRDNLRASIMALSEELNEVELDIRHANDADMLETKPPVYLQ